MIGKALRSRRAFAAAGGTAVLASLVCGGLATGAPRAAHRAAASPCTAAQTEVWLGDGEGGGTAGTFYYPLEFTNISHRTCTFFGYPGVSAIRGGRQVGKAADRNGASHGTVTLHPGATGHALLGIHDWGAICSSAVNADGLRVFAPGQRSSFPIGFPLAVCAHQSVLVVGPLRSGVGIPGYTTS